MSRLVVALTGAGGFLGSALAKRLATHPGVGELRCLYSRPATRLPDSKVVPFVGDLLSPATAGELVTGCDAVVHLATRGFPGDSVANPARLVADNLVAAGHLFQAMADARVGRLVLSASGGAVYRAPEKAETRLTEESPLEPRTAYGVMKLALEHLVGLYERLHGIRACSLRLANPFGAGQLGRSRQGFFGVALGCVLRQTPLPLWAPLGTRKDFLYIDDAIEAFVTALTADPFPSGAFNVGSGKGTTLEEAIRLVEKVTGSRLEIQTFPPRPTDTPFVLDCGKIQRILGWRPKIDLEEGVRLTWETIRREKGRKAA